MYKERIKSYLEKECEILKSFDAEEIDNVMRILEKARGEGRHIFVFGNGGSAATASHMAGDFNKAASIGVDSKYRFEALNDNIPMMMAVANDLSYNDIFVEQLKNKVEKEDVVIGISGSGNSENVVRALEYGNSIGAITIGLVGYDGGRIKKIAKETIHVRIDNMQIVEDVHLIINHIMVYILSGIR